MRQPVGTDPFFCVALKGGAEALQTSSERPPPHHRSLSQTIGVKHFHLANGRKVVAAGELKISSGSYEWNLLSGTFSIPIMRAGGLDDMQRTMHRYFENSFGHVGRETGNETVFTANRISLEELAILCQKKIFLKHNDHVCKDAGLGAFKIRRIIRRAPDELKGVRVAVAGLV